MSSYLSQNSLIQKAAFGVEWRQQKFLEAKIRADFTGSEGDKKEVERHIRELEIDQNYLDTLISKFEEFEKPETPEIVRWALNS
jgi:hypothetical protein